MFVPFDVFFLSDLCVEGYLLNEVAIILFQFVNVLSANVIFC